jgi:hypothetical protein
MYLGVNPQKNGANLLLADVAAVRRHVENKCSINDFFVRLHKCPPNTGGAGVRGNKRDQRSAIESVCILAVSARGVGCFCYVRWVCVCLIKGVRRYSS